MHGHVFLSVPWTFEKSGCSLNSGRNQEGELCFSILLPYGWRGVNVIVFMVLLNLLCTSKQSFTFYIPVVHQST